MGSKTGRTLAEDLREVAAELSRSADLLEDLADDTPDFFDEVNQKISRNYEQWFEGKTDEKAAI